MPGPSSTAIFYVFLIAPGFVAVATTVSLAAVERDYSRFTRLVWSVVLSILIDSIAVLLYQEFVGPIQSFNQMSNLLFNPGIQVQYIFFMLFLSVFIGIGGALFILFNTTDRARQFLQRRHEIAVNPRQPWANFNRDTQWVRIKTSDDQTFLGLVAEWSRANRPKELKIIRPHILEKVEGEKVYNEVGAKSMLFLEDDIQRVFMISDDRKSSLLERIPVIGSRLFDSSEEDKEGEKSGEEQPANESDTTASDETDDPETESEVEGT